MRRLYFLILILMAAFVVGGFSGRHDFAPWPQIWALGDWFSGKHAPASRYVFDKFGRLVADERRPPVDCPKQTPRTAVLLVLGQSNAANYGGQRFVSRQGANIVNFFAGKCYIAASPLLGSTGTKGEYWTQLANLMVESKQSDQVVIAPLAFSGSEISRWAAGGDLNPLLIDTVTFLKKQGYSPTSILWDQGEVDFVKGTSEEAYKRGLLSLVDTLRAQGANADFYVTTASKCLEPSNGGLKTHTPDNPVVRAQLAVVEDQKGIKSGVDTDALLDDLDRYDDCHIGGSGAQKVAHAWANLLLASQQPPPQTR